MVPLTFDRTSSSFAMMESAQAADTKGLLIKRQLQQGRENNAKNLLMPNCTTNLGT